MRSVDDRSSIIEIWAENNNLAAFMGMENVFPTFCKEFSQSEFFGLSLKSESNVQSSG